jgi:hypothetical protein
MKKLTHKIIERLTRRDREKGDCDSVDATCQAEVGMMTRLFGDAGRQIALDR